MVAVTAETCRSLYVEYRSGIKKARAESDDPCAETRFRLSEKRTSPFESAGVSAQSAGQRLSVNLSREGDYYL
jgi:hypothetical protein